MFYPEDSLKRGGRFYLCWVADSWPLRFATITHRQLWSQDIRRICGDLLEVMTNESGRPTQRFSLRLSSQLLRGLVRLYQRKVNSLLGDLCMINSYVIKHANKKWNIHEVKVIRPNRRPLQQLQVHEIVEEPPETIQRIEEMIQASGNAVANIQEITLREPTEGVIDSMLLKPNDGFGEENPDQPMQLFQDRTIETMLNPNASNLHAHSGMDIALDTTDKSHDKSRLYVKDAQAQMERISEHDLTIFRKSTADELQLQFEKDIPEIPEIPPIEFPVPPPEKIQEDRVPEELMVVAVESPRPPVSQQIELEELEPQARRRKLRNKLIIDKNIKISTQHFRARIENHMVELRCQESADDIISTCVPPELYFQRPCHGGMRFASNIGFQISKLFLRNLGVMHVQPRAERELEEVMHRSSRNVAMSVLERIEEEREIPIVPTELQGEIELVACPVNVTNELLNITELPSVSVVEPMELDITDVITQKVETLSQARKRTAEQDTMASIKRQRSAGYMTFRENQLAKQTSIQPADLEDDKENRPHNLQQQRRVNIEESVPEIANNEKSQPVIPTEEIIVSTMLHEVGLADMQITVEAEVHAEPRISQRGSRVKSARGNQSDSSETPLGSLDRTKVSLGDSEQTTDSKRFIRDQWGTEGTMLKILKFVKIGNTPVNVERLIAKGPIIPGHKRIIAARCFTSILKLKQHGFINICKDIDTLGITNISLGPKLSSSQELI